LIKLCKNANSYVISSLYVSGSLKYPFTSPNFLKIFSVV
jgi:hypothetical protein